jgi:hypothetical protein
MESRFYDYELTFILKNWGSHFEIYFRNGHFHVFDVAAESWFVGVFNDQKSAVEHCLVVMGVSPLS